MPRSVSAPRLPQERDSYGNEVPVQCARVPVAYVLVDVPCGVAAPPAPALWAGARFPPAHRPLHHHLQTLAALAEHVAAAPRFLDAMSDLHALLYLCTNEALPLSPEQLAPLLRAVAARDAAAADAWRRSAPAATLDQLMRAAAEQRAPAPAAAALWTCQLCTFHNAAAHDSCEMCAMPR